MSKNKDKSADGGTPEKAEQVETPKKATAVEIVVRRELNIGTRILRPGDAIATVQLPEDVDLNFVVDAVRNGFAGRKK